MLLQWYLQTESYFRLLASHFATICPKIPLFGHFLLFFTIFACLWASSLPHYCLCLQTYFHWVLLQWYLYRESNSWLLSPTVPAICLKIQFLDIFSHFSLFLPAHGWPLNPTSTFIDKNVITGCFCNDICKERATLGYYHPIFPPSARKCNF